MFRSNSIIKVKTLIGTPFALIIIFVIQSICLVSILIQMIGTLNLMPALWIKHAEKDNIATL